MASPSRERQIAAVWDWLPAFRAIAETQHLPSAAKRMGVTAPALSRTLRLLEDQLQVTLFHRVGRRLQLAPDGQVLLSAVRDAMRRVHDALERVSEREDSGPVFVATSGLATHYVTRAIATLARQYPELEPRIRSTTPPEVRADLLAGRLDVAFMTARVEDPNLHAQHLWDEPTSVWCGKEHALYGRTDISLKDMLQHGFVAPPPLLDGTAPEGWPGQTDRIISVRVDQMVVGAQLCQAGVGLAVLPNITARTLGSLWRIPVDITPTAPFFAIRRRSLGDKTSRADRVVEAVIQAISNERPQNVT